MKASFGQTVGWQACSLMGFVCALMLASSPAAADTITLAPVSDTWVEAANPDTNYDGGTEARIANNNLKFGLMLFDVPASLQTGNAVINSVTLQLDVMTTNTVFYHLVQAPIEWVSGEATYNSPSAAANGWDGAGGNTASVIDASLNGSSTNVVGGGGGNTNLDDNGRNFATTTGMKDAFFFTNPLAGGPGAINEWADGTKVPLAQGGFARVDVGRDADVS